MQGLNDMWRRQPAMCVGLAIAALVLVRIISVIATPLEIGPDEAQYWRWSRTLDWGYYSKPPLIAWAIALTTASVREWRMGGPPVGPDRTWLRRVLPVPAGAQRFRRAHRRLVGSALSADAWGLAVLHHHVDGCVAAAAVGGGDALCCGDCGIRRRSPTARCSAWPWGWRCWRSTPRSTCSSERCWPPSSTGQHAARAAVAGAGSRRLSCFVAGAGAQPCVERRQQVRNAEPHHRQRQLEQRHIRFRPSRPVRRSTRWACSDR